MVGFQVIKPDRRKYPKPLTEEERDRVRMMFGVATVTPDVMRALWAVDRWRAEHAAIDIEMGRQLLDYCCDDAATLAVSSLWQGDDRRPPERRPMPEGGGVVRRTATEPGVGLTLCDKCGHYRELNVERRSEVQNVIQEPIVVRDGDIRYSLGYRAVRVTRPGSVASWTFDAVESRDGSRVICGNCIREMATNAGVSERDMKAALRDAIG